MDLGTLLSVLVILVIFLVIGTLAYGGWSAAPWVPLWRRDVRRMLALAEIKPGEKLIDLGAGDGRIIVMAARRYQANAVGYEIAILPFFFGYIRIILTGTHGRAELKYKNFFHQDLGQADVITAFLTPQAMEKLKPKLETETKPGCRVVSYAFAVPGWQPTKIDKPNQNASRIFLYRR